MYNPTRRNRNIGTSRQGHGQDNRQTIQPGRNIEYEVDQAATLGSSTVSVLQERLLPGFAYYVTSAEVVDVLEELGHDVEGIRYIVFFQPSRKQAKLRPIWAKYEPSFSYRGISGPAVFISAVDVEVVITWPRSLSNYAKHELERLQEEGHKITMTDREISIRSSPTAVGVTQLGRSILHEVGHHIYRVKGLNSPTPEEFADSYARKNRRG